MLSPQIRLCRIFLFGDIMGFLAVATNMILLRIFYPQFNAYLGKLSVDLSEIE